MKKIKEMLDALLLRVKTAADKFVEEDRGDTNFISIAIILVVVIAIAIVFITFGDDITGKLRQATRELMDALS